MSGAGTGGGIRYTTLGSTTSTQIQAAAPAGTDNTRVVNIYNDATNQPQLYTSSASGTFIGVNSVGTGLPTTSGQTMTLLPGTAADTSTNPMDFWFKDATTLYKANGTGGGPGVAKYTFNSGTSMWDLQYVLNRKPDRHNGHRWRHWYCIGQRYDSVLHELPERVGINRRHRCLFGSYSARHGTHQYNVPRNCVSCRAHPPAFPATTMATALWTAPITSSGATADRCRMT